MGIARAFGLAYNPHFAGSSENVNCPIKLEICPCLPVNLLVRCICVHPLPGDMTFWIQDRRRAKRGIELLWFGLPWAICSPVCAGKGKGNIRATLYRLRCRSSAYTELGESESCVFIIFFGVEVSSTKGDLNQTCQLLKRAAYFILLV